MPFHRRPILDQLLPFVHPEDASADWLLCGNNYEWYAGYAAELRPVRILEIGTRRGYSLLAMLLACDSVREVVAFDNESYGITLADARHNLARWISNAHQSVAFEAQKLDTQTVNRLPVAAGFDLIHVDGDHTFAGALHDLQLAADVLAPAGVIVLDDVTFYREVDRALSDFLEREPPGAWLVDRIPSLRGHALLRRQQSGSTLRVETPDAERAATQLETVVGSMFRPKTLEHSRQQVASGCNGYSTAERWEPETQAFARAIGNVLTNAATAPLVVDYGCGCGRLARELLNFRPELFVLGVDTSAEQREFARQYVANESRFEAADPASLDEADATAELAYAVYVLQHVPAVELRDVIRRIHRVLKPEGRFVYCGSDYRFAVSANGFFDDRFLGVDVRQEIERLFVEDRDLFDLADESQLIRDMITAEGCPAGSIAHPAKVYRKGVASAVADGVP